MKIGSAITKPSKKLKSIAYSTYKMASDGEDSFDDFASESDNEIIDPSKPVTRLTKPKIDNDNMVGHTDAFAPSVSMIHFAGVSPGSESVFELKIINISKVNQRMQIFPPYPSDVFKTEYTNSGTLAPGLSQKILVKFKPTEYKYYNDILKIRGKEKTLLIPLHGYPVLNKVEFPSQITFGNTPLCEPRSKTIQLSCSIPVSFSYKLTIDKPHPYFKVEPLSGIISANGTAEITVTFYPFTLGSCVINITLDVGQYGFKPMNCIVSAKACSGFIESEELLKAEKRVLDYMLEAGNLVNNKLGANSTFRGDLSLKNENDGTQGPSFFQTKFLTSSKSKPGHQDPVSSVLSATFRSTNLNVALDKVVNDDNLLLGSKALIYDKEKGSNSFVLKGTLPVPPRGVGSGAVFDAGSEWITMQMRNTSSGKPSKHGVSQVMKGINKSDKIVEGLRLPPNLNTTYNVSFVLTQEPGKLKPKDLKVAIDKSRAEREIRQAEQEKLREAGGGAGSLDLRGILAEERLNMEEGDPFKRQLREMAFLADVDDVDKTEIQKQFRVSEEYLGSLQLSQADIDVILKQRKQSDYHKKRASWRKVQSNQHTKYFHESHASVKAGNNHATSLKVINELVPHFDPNKNDIWSKRINTARKLVSLVSKWMMNNRVNHRLRKVRQFFKDNGVTTNAEGRKLVENENFSAKSKPGTITSNKKKDSSLNNEIDSLVRFPSVALMVCSKLDPRVIQRQLNETIISNGSFNPSVKSCRRNLFPLYKVEESAERTAIPVATIKQPITFEDKTYFELQIKPDYITMEYTLMKPPVMPMYFPPCDDQITRVGAFEEVSLRPQADRELTLETCLNSMPPTPPILAEYHNYKTLIAPQVPTVKSSNDDDDDDESITKGVVLKSIEDNFIKPAWLDSEAVWDTDELDFFRVRHDLRVYMPEPKLTECDNEWLLRPKGMPIEMDVDNSLRNKWLSVPGFLSAQNYIFASHESRSTDPVPPPGPTLSDVYFPDTDRHKSGLNCFHVDHCRSLYDHDNDIPSLRKKQDKADTLTDSESDEESYPFAKPSKKLVRSVLTTPAPVEVPVAEAAPAGKGAKGGKPDPKAAAAAAAAASVPAPVQAVEVEIEEDDKKQVQVELLRDRKILDLESTFKNIRQADSVAIADKLSKLSSLSSCSVQKIPVQIPFHVYEEKVYSTIQDKMNILPVSCIENPDNSGLTTSMNSLRDSITA
jgi:hypothetical protein